MIHVKTPAEIKKMRHGGKILGDVLYELVKSVRPGITEIELDRRAQRLIRERGGAPGFQKVPGYRHAICTSVNNIVVHGIPTKRVLEEGDVVGIDCGVYFEGYHTDMAETIKVQSSKLKVKSREVDRFLKTGKEALFAGISQARPGNRVGHISRAMQEVVEGAGYSVVRNLVGHGVGRELHEEPEIPGFLSRKIENTPELMPGMTIAIEIIYNRGGRDVVYSGQDDWTIVTADGSISGLFERSIVITDTGHEFLTKFPDDPEV